MGATIPEDIMRELAERRARDMAKKEKSDRKNSGLRMDEPDWNQSEPESVSMNDKAENEKLTEIERSLEDLKNELVEKRNYLLGNRLDKIQSVFESVKNEKFFAKFEAKEIFTFFVIAVFSAGLFLGLFLGMVFQRYLM